VVGTRRRNMTTCDWNLDYQMRIMNNVKNIGKIVKNKNKGCEQYIKKKYRKK
jgi:hypothetical protein